MTAANHFEFNAFADAETTVVALAQHIVTSLQGDIVKVGRASLVVSGGRTPLALFQRLSTSELDWSKVTVTLADERWVPEHHEDSNAGLVKRALLIGNAASASFEPLYTGDATPEEGEASAAARINGMQQPFSAVILGMGTDGHFASCFPGAPNLETLLSPETTASVLAVRPETTKHPRITLTAPCLLRARFIALQIHGDTKRTVFESARDNGLPVGRLHAEPIQVFWSP